MGHGPDPIADGAGDSVGELIVVAQGFSEGWLFEFADGVSGLGMGGESDALGFEPPVRAMDSIDHDLNAHGRRLVGLLIGLCEGDADFAFVLVCKVFEFLIECGLFLIPKGGEPAGLLGVGRENATGEIDPVDAEAVFTQYLAGGAEDGLVLLGRKLDQSNGLGRYRF